MSSTWPMVPGRHLGYQRTSVKVSLNRVEWIARVPVSGGADKDLRMSRISPRFSPCLDATFSANGSV
jgi:hypothetical protein